MQGKLIGFKTCGYGERFLIQVDQLPTFKNAGYNVFIPNNKNDSLYLDSPLDKLHSSNFNLDFPERDFSGWVFITDGQKDTCIYLYNWDGKKFTFQG